MPLRSRIVTLGAVGTLALTMAACGGGGAGSTPGGTITIGVSDDQPGLGEKDGDRFSGFEVDVALYVAQELGFAEDRVVFIQTPVAGPASALQRGQVALVLAAFAITDGAKDQVSFAGPYVVAGQDLLVRADDVDITGPDAMNGKALCSVPGTASAQRVRDEYASTVRLVEMDSYARCVEALAGGTVDAVTTENLILAGFAAEPQYAGRLEVVGRPFSTVAYGVGLRKGDTELCRKVRAALETMISEGSWQRALDANLGPSGFRVDPATNPPTPDPCA